MQASQSNLETAPWRWGLAIFALALAVRSLFLWQFSSFPLFAQHVMDMDYFHRLATVGIPQTGFPDGVFFKAPLYPLFLKAVYCVFGAGPWGARLVQVVFGSLTVLLTFNIGVRLFSLKAGVIAGILTAVAGTLVLYDGQILVPTLAIFLNLLALWLIFATWPDKRRFLMLIPGFVLGLSAIARPTVLLFVLAALGYIYWSSRKQRGVAWKRPLLMLAGAAIAIAPVTIRNYAESGEFVLIGTYGGINLYIGNNLQSDGVSTRVPGTGLDWWQGGSQYDTKLMAESDVGHELTVPEESTYWGKRAIKEIVNNPGFFVGHVGFKALLFLGGYELANNFDIRYISKQIPILKYLILHKPIYWPWGILLPLGVVGMVLYRGWRREHWLLVVYLISLVPGVLLFFVTARYRLPLVPVLAIFAGVAIERLTSRALRPSGRRLAIAGIILVGLVIVGRLDPRGYASGSDAQGHQLMAALYDDAGDQAQAEKYYRLALLADPTLPHAHNDLGLLLMHRGDYQDAVEHLEQAARYRPDEWLIQYNLGLAYQRTQQWRQAVDQFQLTRRMAPEMPEASRELAVSWLSLGQADSALAAYRQIAELQADDHIYHFSVGLCHHIMGQRDSALSHYLRSLELEPSYPKTYHNLALYWIEADNPDSARTYLLGLRDLPGTTPDLKQQAERLLDSLASH